MGSVKGEEEPTKKKKKTKKLNRPNQKHDCFIDVNITLSLNKQTNIIVKQLYWYISQISGESVQDHYRTIGPLV